MDTQFSYEEAGQVIWVPLIEIYADSEFNCRAPFAPSEVRELAQSIAEEGQKMPLLIQPMDDVPLEEQPYVPAWNFRLVAGYRRYMAIDKWTTLDKAKCIVEKGLSKQQARALNLTENLQRENLNMVEEAIALKRAWAGEDIIDIARYIGKPRRWIQTRLGLLDLPEYVQKKAALPKIRGGLSEHEVEALTKCLPEEVEPLYQKIVSTNSLPAAPPIIRPPSTARKLRGRKEIESTLGKLFRNHHLSYLSEKHIECVTSTLAWILKEINSKEFIENRLEFPEGSAIVDISDKLKGFKETEED